jgi:TRAP-type mannitol/chloroaromatic compound transport system permease small subunit
LCHRRRDPSGEGSVIALLKRIEEGCAWFGRAVGWATPILVISVCLSVLMVHLRINTLFEWDFTVPLFGHKITMNGLTDLQWHLFAVMVMLGGVYALHTDSHVSVDFIASNFTERTRRIIVILGDIIFLLPFAAVMTWFAWKFMASAYLSHEGSSYDGLADRWIVKAVMPLGFGLLGLLGLARTLRLIVQLILTRGAVAEKKIGA